MTRPATGLAGLMFTNLYMIPQLLDRPVEPLDISSASNDAELGHVEYLPKAARRKLTEFVEFVASKRLSLVRAANT